MFQKTLTAYDNIKTFVNDILTEKFAVRIVREKGLSNPLVFVFKGKMTKTEQDRKTDLMSKSLRRVKLELKFKDNNPENPRYFSNVIQYAVLLEKELLKEKSINEVSIL